MSKFIIDGGKKLYGDVNINGAKNSALPILAATVLCQGKSVIHNCPDLSDVKVSLKILKSLGCKAKYYDSSVFVDSESISNFCIEKELMSRMRSSIIFLSVMLAKLKKANVYLPGGCELGARPIDLHIKGLEKMGAVILKDKDCLLCSLPKGHFNGAKISLSLPSVGATENIILAAATAKGRTVIENAAREPEICDLAAFLNKCGAKIKNAGKSTVTVDGVERLFAAEYSVIPDRIEAVSFMAFTALNQGKVTIKNINVSHLAPVIELLKESGCRIKIYKNILSVESNDRLKAVKEIITMPYPGFPTDAQAPVMAMLTMAKGKSKFIENIFKSRYKHIKELEKMGAKIAVKGKTAVVNGVCKLSAANLKCTDLRGGAAVVTAALAGEGRSTVSDIYHIERGYENIDLKLVSLGAKIKRID